MQREVKEEMNRTVVYSSLLWLLLFFSPIVKIFAAINQLTPSKYVIIFFLSLPLLILGLFKQWIALLIFNFFYCVLMSIFLNHTIAYYEVVAFDKGEDMYGYFTAGYIYLSIIEVVIYIVLLLVSFWVNKRLLKFNRTYEKLLMPSIIIFTVIIIGYFIFILDGISVLQQLSYYLG